VLIELTGGGRDTYACIYVCIRVCMYACMYVRMQIGTHVYIYQ
jgi:hypothetical protein